MEKKSILLPILLTAAVITGIAFGLLGYFSGSQTTYKKDSIPAPTTYEIRSSMDTSDWTLYQGEDYSFNYPKGLEVDFDSGGSGVESVRVQFIGPKQLAVGKIDTELFDGYSFMVLNRGSSIEVSPGALAEKNQKNTKSNCGPDAIISAVTPAMVNSWSGYQYAVSNCLGNYTATYLTDEYTFEIIEFYTGEEKDLEKYQTITNAILSTIKFTPRD